MIAARALAFEQGGEEKDFLLWLDLDNNSAYVSESTGAHVDNYIVQYMRIMHVVI